MDTIAAICKCKSLSENNLVVAVREKPLENWGFFIWTFNILMLLVTLGGWFPFAFGWVMGRYWLSPTYRCQHCSSEIPKHQFRVTNVTRKAE